MVGKYCFVSFVSTFNWYKQLKVWRDFLSWHQSYAKLPETDMLTSAQSEGTSYLSSIRRDGTGHNSLQVTAETDPFHRDDSFLGQNCSKDDEIMVKKNSLNNLKLQAQSVYKTRINVTTVCNKCKHNLLFWIFRVWFIC